MIEIKNISKSFSRQPVLKNLSLIFNSGEISLISGNNGSGKSTLINIISCIIKPDSGGIYFSNKKIGFYDYKYRNQVGYLLDKPFYIEKLNAVEFLSFLLKSYRIFDKNSKSEILSFLKLFQLPYDILIENYSKGMKKKLSIISALIHNPKFLIMDEPSASLDTNSIEIFQSLLLCKKRNNCTIIISSPTNTNFIKPDNIIKLFPQKPIYYE